MTARRGKLVGLGAAGVGVVILLVAGFASTKLPESVSIGHIGPAEWLLQFIR